MGKKRPSQRHWEVDKIVAVKVEEGVELYEVKWVDYDETTWEPLENLKACPKALEEFLSHTNKKRKSDDKEPKKTPKKLRESSATPRRRIRSDSLDSSQTAPATRAGLRANESEPISSSFGSKNNSATGPRLRHNRLSSGEAGPRKSLSPVAPPPLVAKAPSPLVSKSLPPPLVPNAPRSSKQRAEDVEGLRRNWEPQSILTCYEAPDDMYYVVKWKNIGNPSIVSSTNLRQTHPDLLITYLQEKLNCMMQRGSGSSP